MCEEIMERHHLFLVAARMGCLMLFRGSFFCSLITAA